MTEYFALNELRYYMLGKSLYFIQIHSTMHVLSVFFYTYCTQEKFTRVQCSISIHNVKRFLQRQCQPCENLQLVRYQDYV